MSTDVFLIRTHTKTPTKRLDNGRQSQILCGGSRSRAGVLLKVVEAKKLLETERRAITVAEATDEGISRSSFYKYKG